LCERCGDPWDECLCDFKNLPDDESEDEGDLFTACESCGWFGIPIDGEGCAAELCEACENPHAVQVARILSELSVDLEGMHLPDMSERAKEDYLRTIAEAVHLLRVHAVPASHPWSIS
jgi:hypothetical protein